MSQKPKAGTATRADGLTAWEQIYSVLTHPRCINCHTATNYPQQGDDRRRHFANVIRGPEGQGVAGLNCASCQSGDECRQHGIAGGHHWHLAPLSMRWQRPDDQSSSSAAVVSAVTDRSKNHVSRAWIVEASRRRASCPVGLEPRAATRRDDEDPTATNPCRVRRGDSPLDQGRRAVSPRKNNGADRKIPWQPMNSMSMASANMVNVDPSTPLLWGAA